MNVKLSQFGYSFMHSLGGTGLSSPVGLQPRGYLFLAREDQAASLRERTRNVRALGGSIEEFDPTQLAHRFPWINCSGVAYAAQGIEGEGWFDGYLLQQFYRSGARRLGVSYVQGEVSGLAVSGSKVTAVELASGERLAADRVVNAAGAWSAAVAHRVGVELPVRARRRTPFVVSCPGVR